MRGAFVRAIQSSGADPENADHSSIFGDCEKLDAINQEIDAGGNYTFVAQYFAMSQTMRALEPRVGPRSGDGKTALDAHVPVVLVIDEFRD